MENIAHTPQVSQEDAQFLKVTEMVHCYVESIGLNRTEIYDEQKKNWMWKRGSAGIEVFINRLVFESGNKRDFIKTFSPVMDMPPNADAASFYRRLLELNDEKLGIKLSMMPGSNKVWATFERDIKGIDYNELATFIADFEYWANQLDDMLKAEFSQLN